MELSFNKSVLSNWAARKHLSSRPDYCGRADSSTLFDGQVPEAGEKLYIRPEGEWVWCGVVHNFSHKYTPLAREKEEARANLFNRIGAVVVWLSPTNQEGRRVVSSGFFGTSLETPVNKN